MARYVLQTGGLHKQRSGVSSRQGSMTSRTVSDMNAMYGGLGTPATAMSSMTPNTYANPTPRHG